MSIDNPLDGVPSLTLHTTLHSPTVNTRTWSSQPHPDPDTPLLATASSDKTANIWDMRSWKLLSTVSGGHKRSIRCVGWKDYGSNQKKQKTETRHPTILATGSFDANVGLWEWNSPQAESEPQVPGSFETDEQDFTKESKDEEEEWHFSTLLTGPDSEIKDLKFSPSHYAANLLATCSRDKSVWVWEELDGDNFETMAVLQDHEGDVKCVAWHPEEQLLASGSYDDRIRLWREDVDDWACCTLLDGHAGTVWWLEFEASTRVGKVEGGEGETDEQKAFLEERTKAGARLMSCSDDKTIRVWRRKPKEKPDAPPTGQGRMPSIWKNNNFEEEWVEEARLPQLHDRPIYAVSWSKKTGRVVSAGSDGIIVVYEERWRRDKPVDIEMANTVPEAANGATEQPTSATEWVVVAQIENAHDVFEVNHVTWAPRYDKGKRSADEEIVISTGDDGDVKAWVLDV